jgi:hypothetical protein
MANALEGKDWVVTQWNEKAGFIVPCWNTVMEHRALLRLLLSPRG